MELTDSNNRAELMGTLEGEPVFSHEIYGEAFYLLMLCVPRLSGAADHIRVIASERLLSCGDISDGENITVIGQFRSYNAVEGGTSKLILSVFARDIYPAEACTPDNPNTLYLNGFICKEPVYRTTPFGREICDMMIAVNRAFGKSDYLPCIAWGRNAQYASRFHVGDRVHITGRLQSREYQKLTESGEYITRNAYEISAFTLEADELPPHDPIAPRAQTEAVQTMPN